MRLALVRPNRPRTRWTWSLIGLQMKFAEWLIGRTRHCIPGNCNGVCACPLMGPTLLAFHIPTRSTAASASTSTAARIDVLQPERSKLGGGSFDSIFLFLGHVPPGERKQHVDSLEHVLLSACRRHQNSRGVSKSSLTRIVLCEDRMLRVQTLYKATVHDGPFSRGVLVQPEKPL